MTSRPRLVRSVPYWALVAGSAASLGYGIWLTNDKLSIMSASLTDGTATGVEVYVGQSWAVFAAAFVAAGLIGLVAALALAAGRSLAAQRPVEVVEAIAWAQDEPPVDPDDAPIAVPEADAPENDPAADTAPRTLVDDETARR